MTRIIQLFIAALLLTSCSDFVKVDPPRTSLSKEATFSDDVTADAAVIDIYYRLRSGSFASGGVFSISFLTTLSSDEQDNYYASTAQGTADMQQFNSNSLIPSNDNVYSLWSDMYAVIYRANAVIEGLSSSTGVTEATKNQLIGEAYFLRAFCNFYLVNLWGAVPLAINTDYETNSSLPRTAEADIYARIISDLIVAKGLLTDGYWYSDDERVRANKSVATALLARAYLYSGEWQNAELQASEVIGNPDYSLVTDLNTVTTKNNSESLLQLWSSQYPNEIYIFYVFAAPSAGALRKEFADQFEEGDERRAHWIDTISMNGIRYYYTKKYSSFEQGAEYSTVLRLAEQYLIRAEARAHQNNLAGASEDINVIRSRAGLGDTPAADQTSLLEAVYTERRSELFCEWGHRWLDLKRTDRATTVLKPIKPQWTKDDELYPIPLTEILKNISLKNSQNPGY